MACLRLTHVTQYEATAKAVVAKLPPAGRVLDVGSGSGEPAISIAKMLPTCSVVATDSQQNMVGKIVARGAGRNVTAQQMDANETYPFPDASFDAVTMGLLLMFCSPSNARSSAPR